MPKLVVANADGEEATIERDAGTSVMRAIKDAGLDGLMALCGGCRACGTCHVYVDTPFLVRLPEMTRDEDELLVQSSRRTANSRLSCQIPLTDELDGLRVTIVRED